MSVVILVVSDIPYRPQKGIHVLTRPHKGNDFKRITDHKQQVTLEQKSEWLIVVATA